MASIIDERGFNQGFKLTHAQRVRLRRRAAAIVEEMHLPVGEARAGVHVLEMGCGTGELAVELAKTSGAKVTGVDISPKFIQHAQQIHQLERLDFIVADLSRPPSNLQRQRYDYIVGNGILHHLYHRLPSFLAIARQWLRPGGKLVFWEPNLANPYIYLIFSYPPFRRMARLEPDEMAFSKCFILRELKAAGYYNIRVDMRDFLLPNTPDGLVAGVIRIGNLLEHTPGIRRFAQSLFIRATSTDECKCPTDARGLTY